MAARTVWQVALTLILIFMLFIQLKTVECKKTSSRSLIEDIIDAKELKKLCRTKNNVLVLFTRSMKESHELMNVFSKVAEEIKGQATLAVVDCSGEAKKLCRKLKVNPEPHLLKHYRDGDFHKDYDRRHTVQSMVNFLKDPSGDLPWEEDDRGKDILHISDANILGKVLHREKLPIMVMFYAPWCGFCKRLKPEYEAAATELKGHSILAAMDVNKPENAVVRQHFNITGFPTLLYFEGGHLKHKYDGENNKESIINFMKNPENQPEKPKEAEWSDTPSDVVHLTDETFNSFLESEPSLLVMFYAPWCGHCKKMKPEYVLAAATMKEENIPGILAAVDATKEKALAERFKINGYPTVKYFKDGNPLFEVSLRTADKIVEFMKDPKEPPPPPPPEIPWSEEPSSVVHLNEEDFKPFLRRKKHVLVMFYAPWCGHCKKAKPEFQAAADYFKDDPKVEFAAIDCTSYSSVCSAHEVKGYPTLKYFSYYKVEKPYEGLRTESDFVEYMKSAVDGTPPPAMALRSTPEKWWSDIPDGQHVHLLKADDFDEKISSQESALVMFYAPWCGHCKTLKPEFAKAAAKLKDNKLPGFLAAVDATEEKALSERFKITGFPTLNYFKEGNLMFKINFRTADKIFEFMKDPKEPPPPPPPETPWSEEQSNVVHLNEENFKSFLERKKHVLLMFYAPWCGYCKKAKPEFQAAADIFKDNPEVEFAAIDCTSYSSVCSAHDVKGYPTLRYFSYYKVEKPYEGGRTESDFVKYMKSAADGMPAPTTTPPPPPEKWWSDLPNGQHVHLLKEEQFEEKIRSRKCALVMFYAPWCGHCKSLKPEFAKAAAKLKERKVDCILAAVDSTVEHSLSNKYSVRAFPTVIYFKNGNLVKEYEQGRSAEEIVTFVLSQTAGREEL